ncbi:MAG: hypothetical protein RIC19_12275 [Phaeodactylibacter sp.]|uniref:hypothetical protein n=1 Tax=Phaeodactylibacter sp. TaxID=1940289 RepID=UPI0032EEA131
MKQTLLSLVFSFGLFFLLGLGGCAADPPQATSFEDCLYGAPEPIFDGSVRGVSKHQFELRPGMGIERFVLNQATQVRIEQTGCDQLQQRFTFSWDAGTGSKNNTYWSEQAILKYQELGELGAPYLSFSAISEVLQKKQNQLTPRGEAIVLQPGLYFRIEQAQQGQRAELVTLLYESTASGN